MYEISFEKIEQYLKGEMNRKDQLLLESKLIASEELASVLKLYQIIETEMINKEKFMEEEAALKNTLQNLTVIFFHDKFETNKVKSVQKKPFIRLVKNQRRKDRGKTKAMSKWRKVAIAAGVFSLTTLGVTRYLQSTKNTQEIVVSVNINKKDSSINTDKSDTTRFQNNITSWHLAKANKPKVKSVKKRENKSSAREMDVLFASNFYPDILPEDKTGPLEDAFAYYESGNYKHAIEAIENADLNLVTRGPEIDIKHLTFYAYYYKAQCYMASRKMTEAISELQKAIIESPDSSLQTKVQWYLSLAYMTTGASEKAKKLLKQVVENKHLEEYKLKANALLKELANK